MMPTCLGSIDGASFIVRYVEVVRERYAKGRILETCVFYAPPGFER